MDQDTCPASVVNFTVGSRRKGGDGGVWIQSIVVAALSRRIIALLVGHGGHPGRVCEEARLD